MHRTADRAMKRRFDQTAILAWVERHRRKLTVAAILLIAALGFAALHNVLAEVHLKQVRGALHEIPVSRMVLALGLTALSYFALTFYDLFALRAIGSPIRWRTAALASFTSYTISHNLGLSLLTGGSARYRVYAAAGLDLGEVAQVSLIASATFWGGILVVAALALLLDAAPIPLGPVTLSPLIQHLAGGLVIALLLMVFGMRMRGVSRIGWGRFSLPIPRPALMSAQIGIASIDLLAASAALFVLVPGATPQTFGAFFLAYALALLAALITHVPGGIGIFETVILAIVPQGRSEVFAALLLYRIIYYLLPLLIAAVIVAAGEARRLRRHIVRGVSVADKVGQALAPSLLALLVFGGGLVLLVSGALPAVHSRLSMLRHILPLPFIDGSHFLASLVGTALLLVAPAINARIRNGFYVARLLLIGGMVFSLLKGVDYEEAIVLGIIGALLQYCRPAFYRRAGVLDAPLLRAWLLAAGLAVVLSIWSGMFAYKHVAYSDDLWWAFAWKGNAPRFLRASLGATVLLVGVAWWRLIWAPVRPIGAIELPGDVAEAAFAAADRTDAALAYTGDKQFLISASGDAFLMYQLRGRTWVVMGDPVGPMAAWPELVWRIRGDCDRAHGRLCFYQASEDLLPLLIEIGLQIMKYGEEAHVDLASFSLQGPAAKQFRAALRRGESLGIEFSVIPAADLPAIGPELQAVSDAWLQSKAGAEKHFSIGHFSPEYLAHFDMAVLRMNGRIIAFANLWATANRSELSVDLMRHFPDTPNGTMDLLFVKLIQWGIEQGYQRFNLGMAPLSGLTGRKLAPLWSRIGHAIYGHAEALYGFSGLRHYKEKFRPNWVPRYIATPPGLGSPRALVDLMALIGD